MIEGFQAGFELIFQWPGPLIMLVGIAIGMLAGVLPGMGAAGATALLLPITYAMDAAHAIAFIVAVNVSSGLGGQLTSILVNIPGDPPNAATILDGYPMTRRGQAAEAMGAATMGSVLGAIIGTSFLLAVVPVARELVLSFSYPEFFMVSFSGLVMIAALTRGQTIKGLISAGLGLIIAFIGLDPATGNPRLVFGQVYLWDGVELVAALVGLFAGAEMLALYGRKGDAAILDTDADQSSSTLLHGIKATFHHWRTVVMSSVIGFVVGVVPGVGGTVASFMAYGQAARSSKDPGQFGKGAVEGVIASETSNDADKSGSILPTIAFGIPGGTSMAILLVALLLHGIPTGPSLLSSDNEILYVIILTVIVPRLIAAVVVLLVGKRAIAITKIRGRTLAPIITVIAALGVYALRNQIIDVFVALIFAYVGYALDRYGYSRVALVIAMVLGPLLEAAYHQTIGTFGLSGFVTRPISLTLFIISLLALFWTPIRQYVKPRRSTGVGV